MNIDPRVREAARRHPCPMVFATVSGSHLYGFPSPDSDWDLRGVHVLPVREVVGLSAGRETIEAETREGIEIDLVTHDVKKFVSLMLKTNGYVLEQLHSPWIVRSSPAHEELKRLARGCVTRHHIHHYLGFAETQWRLFHKENPRRVKPLLYVYRVLLTGIHLMRTGEVEGHLPTLNRDFRLPAVDDLVARKLAGAEQSQLPDADLAFHAAEYERLCNLMREESQRSTLPEGPTVKRELNDLLVAIRMGDIATAS